jgi:hypothetical protein
MFDERSLTTILIQHFPQARQIDIADAAKDLLLFDLLADDRVPVWEDSMRALDKSEPPSVFICNHSRES